MNVLCVQCGMRLYRRGGIGMLGWFSVGAGHARDLLYFSAAKVLLG